MKSMLLISVSALGLIVGTAIASAQAPEPSRHPEPSGPAGTKAQTAPHATPSPRQEGGKAEGAKSPSETPSEPHAQMEPRAQQGAPAEKRAEEPAGREKRAEEPAGREKRAEEPAGREKRADEPAARDDRSQRPTTAQQQPEARPGATQRGGERTTTGMGPARGFSSEQRTAIHSSILKEHVSPATNINFSVDVGGVVPRTIVIHPLPPEIVDIEPEWQGYMFFLTADDIIVVEPDTLRIVAVLPA